MGERHQSMECYDAFRSEQSEGMANGEGVDYSSIEEKKPKYYSFLPSLESSSGHRELLSIASLFIFCVCLDVFHCGCVLY